MRDYYAILGLDTDASPESIKAAYRRLARLHHPDVQATQTTETERASVEAHMAQLNEAYAVLSHGKSRREYDERLHLETSLTVRTTTTCTADTNAGASQSRTVSNKAPRTRVRANEEVDSTVVTQFSAHFREIFLNQAAGFAWKKVQFEGFDWGLEASSWASHYCVAMRGFAVMDLATAKKFINYAETLVGRYRRQLRRSSFLFLVPFRQINEWEAISAQCQPFASRRNRTGIVLLDIHHGRALRFGSPMPDKKFEKIIQSIRTTR
ncbi:MAG: J domain-containing protein [Acidobacteriia bacterium]|nr:J domain-containing protein [Terriglobia bacterium]